MQHAINVTRCIQVNCFSFFPLPSNGHLLLFFLHLRSQWYFSFNDKNEHARALRLILLEKTPVCIDTIVNDSKGKTMWLPLQYGRKRKKRWITRLKAANARAYIVQRHMFYYLFLHSLAKAMIANSPLTLQMPKTAIVEVNNMFPIQIIWSSNNEQMSQSSTIEQWIVCRFSKTTD